MKQYSVAPVHFYLNSFLMNAIKSFMDLESSYHKNTTEKQNVMKSCQVGKKEE